MYRFPALSWLNVAMTFPAGIWFLAFSEPVNLRDSWTVAFVAIVVLLVIVRLGCAAALLAKSLPLIKATMFVHRVRGWICLVVALVALPMLYLYALAAIRSDYEFATGALFVVGVAGVVICVFAMIELWIARYILEHLYGARPVRIRAVFGLSEGARIPHVTSATLGKYRDYLINKLDFPWHSGGGLQVTGLMDCTDSDPAQGLLCHALLEGTPIHLPLAKVHLESESQAYQEILIADYAYWLQYHQPA